MDAVPALLALGPAADLASQTVSSHCKSEFDNSSLTGLDKTEANGN